MLMTSKSYNLIYHFMCINICIVAAYHHVHITPFISYLRVISYLITQAFQFMYVSIPFRFYTSRSQLAYIHLPNMFRISAQSFPSQMEHIIYTHQSNTRKDSRCIQHISNIFLCKNSEMSLRNYKSRLQSRKKLV